MGMAHALFHGLLHLLSASPSFLPHLPIPPVPRKLTQSQGCSSSTRSQVRVQKDFVSMDFLLLGVIW